MFTAAAVQVRAFGVDARRWVRWILNPSRRSQPPPLTLSPADFGSERGSFCEPIP